MKKTKAKEAVRVKGKKAVENYLKTRQSKEPKRVSKQEGLVNYKNTRRSVRSLKATGDGKFVDKGGRDPKWENPDDFLMAVKIYFENKEIKHTWTGLALHLGFTSRHGLYNYRQIDGFKEAIEYALLKIENKYEEMLVGGKNPIGAIFALKQFKWKDKQEIEVTETPENKVSVEIVRTIDEGE